MEFVLGATISTGALIAQELYSIATAETPKKVKKEPPFKIFAFGGDNLHTTAGGGGNQAIEKVEYEGGTAWTVHTHGGFMYQIHTNHIDHWLAKHHVAPAKVKMPERSVMASVHPVASSMSAHHNARYGHHRPKARGRR